jgi:endo-1,4-beta-mannosidase
MFPASSGVLFFGAEGTKPVTWDAIPEFVMDDEDFVEEQSKIFATMRDSPTVTMSCHINKKGIENLMGVIRGFKLARGPARNRMIRRAKKMQINYIYTYTFRKEGDEYVDERGQIRLILQ